MTDLTNSPNFYIGRTADVGDMLLHGQVVSECHAQIYGGGGGGGGGVVRDYIPIATLTPPE